MRLFFRIAKIFSKLANVLILMKLTYSMKSLLVIWLKNFKTNNTFGKRILKKTGLEFGTFMFLRSFVTLFLARVTPIIEFSVELDLMKNKWNSSYVRSSIWKCQISNICHCFLHLAKGQLISEWLLDVFIWTKKRTKIFLYFCPSL